MPFQQKVCPNERFFEGLKQMDDQQRRKQNPCRVCGYSNPEADSLKEARCSCCGIQLGVEDQTTGSVKIWRNRWLTLGGARRDKGDEQK
jgi:hypothetical protein